MIKIIIFLYNLLFTEIFSELINFDKNKYLEEIFIIAPKKV